ncbi:MAG: glycosyl transferase family 1 [Acidobacteria bacterium]|nr:MAG: glycosyl transferase family 1 [Acidobacteriota bacterium]
MSRSGFTPASHPICLTEPVRLASTAWAAHIPFAMLLIDLLRPRAVVELGTFTGVSYCAFCQAVEELKLDTRCYAIDSWRGDEHSGFYGDEILADLKRHHDPLYGAFSSLIESSFDEALDNFEDGAIDLLHIDGYHTYDVVKHDFKSWLPKMSDRGVMLLHDTNVRERDFGVWRLWEEIKIRYPHFEFIHQHGLGVVSIGPNVPDELHSLVNASEAEAQMIRAFFEQIGERLKLRLDRVHQQKVIDNLFTEVATRDSSLADRDATVMALTDELTARDARINAILTCRAWRWSQRASRVKQVLVSPLSPVLDRFQRNGKKKNGKPLSNTPAMRAVRPAALTHVEQAVVLSSPASLREATRNEPQTSARLRPDVVCFSIVDWNFRFQRPQQLMSQFAANGHRVFLIRLDQTLSIQTRPKFSLIQLKENLYQITLAALRPVMINQEDVKGGNADSLCAALEELRAAYGIGEAIAYVMTPSWTTMAQEAKRRWGWRVVYDCMDDWNGFPGFGRLAANAEDRLVDNCDLLVVSANRLYEKWRKRNGPTVLARNAVDFDFYQERCRTNKMLGAKHPIVGYFGAIADWFDLDLMIAVARRRPNFNFVLLGGVFEVDVTELRGLPNVQVLGQQPYETMPQYLYHFDACIIPFKINSTTQATDPVKVYEYLSCGKPVVSVDLPELNSFRELLYVARNRDHFVEQLDKAIAEDDPDIRQRRRKFAAENTWRGRYEAIMAGLSDATRLASIVVVSYNCLAMTRLCLESVMRNTDYPNYEIVVVDNHSSDGTPAYLQKLANRDRRVKIVLNSDNRGFPRAVNQGIAASSGERLVVLNNDTIVSRGWLGRLLRHLDIPEIGLVGPVTNFAGNEAKIAADYRTLGDMEMFADEWMRTNDGQIADIHMLAMFCLALRRETYDRIGPLDEQFGIGMFEDDDYCMRTRSTGLRIVCAADVFVHHFGQAAFKKLIDNGEYEKIFTENRRRYETKWNVTWIAHRNDPLRFEPVIRKVAET